MTPSEASPAWKGNFLKLKNSFISKSEKKYVTMVEGFFEIGLFNTMLAVLKAYVSSPKIVNVILKFSEELAHNKSNRISPQRNSKNFSYNFFS